MSKLPEFDRRRLLGLGFAAIGGMATLGGFANRAFALSASAQAVVTRVERYFNTIRSLTARFTQVDSNGGQASGMLYLRKPGRLRFEYDPPNPMLIVADGTWLVVYDKSIKQVDRYPLDATPLGILVRDKVELNDGLTVTKVVHDAQAFGIEVKDPSHDDMGTITLLFTDNPLEFRQWQVLDAERTRTVVSLDDIKTGIKIPIEKFIFNDPPGTPEIRHGR